MEPEHSSMCNTMEKLDVFGTTNQTSRCDGVDILGSKATDKIKNPLRRSVAGKDPMDNVGTDRYIEEGPRHPKILQSKPGFSRHVTGANSIVPRIPSVGEKSEVKVVERTTAILHPENPEEKPKQMHVISHPYMCVVCRRRFQCKAARARHMLLHCKNKDFCWKCDICDQVFLRAKFLQRHFKEHEAWNICEFCYKTFSKKQRLTQHLKLHNPAIPRCRCSLCPLTFPSMATLHEHIRVHISESPYTCKHCQLKFQRAQICIYPPLKALPSVDAEHIGTLTDKEKLKIQKASALESNREHSTGVQHKIPLSENNSSSCELCSPDLRVVSTEISPSTAVSEQKGTSLENPNIGISAETHKWSSTEQNNYTSADTENNNCTKIADLPKNTICSLKMGNVLFPFTSPEIAAEADKRKLNKVSEEGEKNDSTSTDAENKRDDPEVDCSDDALTQTSQYKDLPTPKKEDQKLRPYLCTECGKTFRYPSDLKRHEDTHSKKRSPKDLLTFQKRCERPRGYVCDKCGKKFSFPSELKRHEVSHSGKRHQCPVCHKMFKRLEHMELYHMKSHSQPHIKPYECELCEKKFSNKYTLQKHSILHSGMKNYGCTICDKAFLFKSYLKTHMETHRRQEKYFQCQICPRKFVSETTRKLHVSKFHRKDIDAVEELKVTDETMDDSDDPTVIIEGVFFDTEEVSS